MASLGFHYSPFKNDPIGFVIFEESLFCCILCFERKMMFFRYFLIGLSAFLLISYVAFGLGVDLTPVSFLYVILANIYMVARSRHNFLLFIVAFILFFCNYSIIYANYTDAIIDIFTKPLSTDSFVTSLNILTLFNALLFLFVQWDYVFPGSKINVFVDVVSCVLSSISR